MRLSAILCRFSLALMCMVHSGYVLKKSLKRIVSGLGLSRLNFGRSGASALVRDVHVSICFSSTLHTRLRSELSISCIRLPCKELLYHARWNRPPPRPKNGQLRLHPYFIPSPRRFHSSDLHQVTSSHYHFLCTLFLALSLE